MRRRLATVLYRLARHLAQSQEMGVQERHLDAPNEVVAQLERQTELLRPVRIAEEFKTKFLADLVSGQIGQIGGRINRGPGTNASC